MTATYCPSLTPVKCLSVLWCWCCWSCACLGLIHSTVYVYTHWQIQGQRFGVPHSEHGVWTYSGVWEQSPSGVQGQSPWSVNRGAKVQWSWTPFCIVTTSGVGQFVLKSVFCKTKKNCQTFGCNCPRPSLDVPVCTTGKWHYINCWFWVMLVVL